ncbi:MAG TPA: DUF1289 domain-containing protein [Xanthobacteraceae bacterium]|nr:DUF1289 domain-containing protein [Xanthobacteraceae bacterium]
MIVSPCERICLLDPATGLCRGCGRTWREIEHWTRYTDAERAQVAAELPQRLATLRARRQPEAGA